MRVEYTDGSVREGVDTGFTVKYAKGDCFHYGDKSVTIEYSENGSEPLSVNLSLQQVMTRYLRTPVLDSGDGFVYNGEDLDLSLFSTEYYDVIDIAAVDAGQYTVRAKIKSEYYSGSDCRWNSTGGDVVDIGFEIKPKPIDLTVTPNGGAVGAVVGAVAASDEIIAGSECEFNYLYNGTADDGTVYADASAPPERAGNYTVTATATGNYAGSATADFIVTKGTPTVDPRYDLPEVIYTSGSLPAIATSNGDNEGTIAWDPYTLEAGVHSFGWTFTPADTVYYNVLTGVSAEFNVKVAELTSVTAEANGKTSYDALTEFDSGSVVINAVYEDSSVKQLHVGPGGYTVRYEDGDCFHVGHTTVTVVYTDGGITKEYTFTGLTVAPLSVARPELTGEYTYNGAAQNVEITHNAASHDTLYTVSGGAATAAGEHRVALTLTNVRDYIWADGDSETLTLVWTIAKAAYDMSGVKFADKAVTYNGSEHSLEATDLPTGVTVTYENNDKTNAGAYTVTAKFSGDADNYELIADLTATLTVNKAVYDMSGVKFADKAVTYNGSEHSLEATDLPTGVTVTYENNGKTNAGAYTVTAKFAGDADNYELIADLTATLTVNKAKYDMSGVKFENVTVTYNGESHSLEVTGLPTGVTVTYENNGQTETGTYTVTAKFSGNANYEAIADMTATLTIEAVVEPGDKKGGCSCGGSLDMTAIVLIGAGALLFGAALAVRKLKNKK